MNNCGRKNPSEPGNPPRGTGIGNVGKPRKNTSGKKQIWREEKLPVPTELHYQRLAHSIFGWCIQPAAPFPYWVSKSGLPLGCGRPTNGLALHIKCQLAITGNCAFEQIIASSGLSDLIASIFELTNCRSLLCSCCYPSLFSFPHSLKSSQYCTLAIAVQHLVVVSSIIHSVLSFNHLH